MPRPALLVSITLVVLALLGLLLWRTVPDYSPVRKVDELSFPRLGERLYVSTEIWGVSYDRRIVIIGVKPRTRADYEPSGDYVYRVDGGVYYRISGDSLVVYTQQESPVPADFNSQVIVSQVVLDAAEFAALARDFEDMGLKRAGMELPTTERTQERGS